MNSQHLYGAYNASFTNNRFGHANSAIRLNSGYYKIPEGVEIDGDFTFLAWVKINTILVFARLFKLSVARGNDSTTYTANLVVFNQGVPRQLYSSNQIPQGVWHHVVNGVINSIGFYYLNGSLQSQKQLYSPRRVKRTQNFIGASSWTTDPFFLGDIDDIKLFKRSLRPEEILNDFLNSK